MNPGSFFVALHINNWSSGPILIMLSRPPVLFLRKWLEFFVWSSLVPVGYAGYVVLDVPAIGAAEVVCIAAIPPFPFSPVGFSALMARLFLCFKSVRFSRLPLKF